MKGPKACIEYSPDSRTVRFGGQNISLRRLQEASGYTVGYLSYLLSGQRNPSTECARKVARCLRMTTDDFFLAVDARKRLKEESAT